jgi:hypothetical protein
VLTSLIVPNHADWLCHRFDYHVCNCRSQYVILSAYVCVHLIFWSSNLWVYHFRLPWSYLQVYYLVGTYSTVLIWFMLQQTDNWMLWSRSIYLIYAAILSCSSCHPVLLSRSTFVMEFCCFKSLPPCTHKLLISWADLRDNKIMINYISILSKQLAFLIYVCSSKGKQVPIV